MPHRENGSLKARLAQVVEVKERRRHEDKVAEAGDGGRPEVQVVEWLGPCPAERDAPRAGGEPSAQIPSSTVQVPSKINKQIKK